MTHSFLWRTRIASVLQSLLGAVNKPGVGQNHVKSEVEVFFAATCADVVQSCLTQYHDVLFRV